MELTIKALGFPWETQDPFLFCAHHADAYPEGNDQLGPATSLEGRTLGQDFTVKDGFRMYHGQVVPGFPSHPHRGFETVTIAKEGVIDHADSLGGAGRFSNGDVQWMTAGKGVQHSEMFPMLHKDKKNPLEMFQIWLNLPRKSKMVDAYYAMLWSEDIPLVEETDGDGKKSEINVIAGDWNGEQAPSPTPDSWANDPANGVAIWTIKMEAGATLVLPDAPSDVSRTLYFYRGTSLVVDNMNVPTYHLVAIDGDEEVQLVNGEETGYLLYLQGKPIKEPVAQYGPFVMNSQEEIQEAFRDYQQTEFGGWPWSANDQVHDPTLGRFAKHPDGTEVFKDQ